MSPWQREAASGLQGVWYWYLLVPDPPVDLSPTFLKSSRGRRNARPAALNYVMTCLQAKSIKIWLWMRVLCIYESSSQSMTWFLWFLRLTQGKMTPCINTGFLRRSRKSVSVFCFLYVVKLHFSRGLLHAKFKRGSFSANLRVSLPFISDISCTLLQNYPIFNQLHFGYIDLYSGNHTELRKKPKHA